MDTKLQNETVQYFSTWEWNSSTLISIRNTVNREISVFFVSCFEPGLVANLEIIPVSFSREEDERFGRRPLFFFWTIKTQRKCLKSFFFYGPSERGLLIFSLIIFLVADQIKKRKKNWMGKKEKSFFLFIPLFFHRNFSNRLFMVAKQCQSTLSKKNP